MLVRSTRTLLLAVALLAAASPARSVLPAFDPVGPDVAIEFHHAGFDHYFLTRIPEEIEALDSGRTTGWTRTGRAFRVYLSQAVPAVVASPVCRFYIPPQHGDSHFFSASAAECTDILNKIPIDPNYSGYILESPNVFYAALPNTTIGACPTGTVPVYRLWNQRTDSNHRYTTDASIRAAMIGKGYVAEGYGSDAVSLCSPGAVLVEAQTRASGLSSFLPGCDGVPPVGIVHVNAEVEPFLAVNPANANNFIGVWQQDRWSNGGARGPGIAFTFDGGGTWSRATAPLSRCSGGTAANGGDYERASDPWITFAPDGTAYQAALAFNNQTNGDNAILVSRSVDGGRTWGNATTLKRDSVQFFNDKEAITADPTDARYVYASWDRLPNSGGGSGPTWFARTLDSGASWEPARVVYDPGPGNQTINNLIVVLPDGTLINFFTELLNTGPTTNTLRLIRSTDQGANWSAPITLAVRQTIGTIDPETGVRIRDGTLLGAIAAGKDGSLAVVWQDARFSGGARDGVAFTRSTDGGFTWSTPIGINGQPAVAAFIPSVTIRDDNTIGVTYYDLRSNTADPNTLPTDYWLATSSNGAIWSERRIAGPFDYTTAPVANGMLFLGDYQGLASVGTTFLPFFAQTTGGSVNRTDIFAQLARASTATASGIATLVKVATDATAITPAFAVRIEQSLRQALAARQPPARKARPPAP